MKAQLSQSRARYVVMLVIVAVALWAAQHVVNVLAVGSVNEYLYSHWVFLFSFAMLVLALTLAHKERPIGASTYEVNHQFVTAVVPAYNEDPAILKECIESLIVQSRPLQEIYVVDDGSNKVDYRDVQTWFEEFATLHNVIHHWIRRENGGKRQAQASAFSVADKAQVFITVDSDSVLDYNALSEILKPFADAGVQSVAGVVLARNNRTNLLARITDISNFLTTQC